jgi:hypothetical protein
MTSVGSVGQPRPLQLQPQPGYPMRNCAPSSPRPTKLNAANQRRYRRCHTTCRKEVAGRCPTRRPRGIPTLDSSGHGNAHAHPTEKANKSKQPKSSGTPATPTKSTKKAQPKTPARKSKKAKEDSDEELEQQPKKVKLKTPARKLKKAKEKLDSADLRCTSSLYARTSDFGQSLRCCPKPSGWLLFLHKPKCSLTSGTSGTPGWRDASSCCQAAA